MELVIILNPDNVKTIPTKIPNIEIGTAGVTKHINPSTIFAIGLVIEAKLLDTLDNEIVVTSPEINNQIPKNTGITYIAISVLETNTIPITNSNI